MKRNISTKHTKKGYLFIRIKAWKEVEDLTLVKNLIFPLKNCDIRYKADSPQEALGVWKKNNLSPNIQIKKEFKSGEFNIITFSHYRLSHSGSWWRSSSTIRQKMAMIELWVME